ncbi:hypothetical protein [Acetobacter indonesiensis]|uniref:Uncharacterized protein n=1 Tax=Acetobacter indonesiensis TaxID=104101 RepID=A0A252AKI0_9PROT|nr:hypothetical protein [Acetobacter indonesiensis]OUI89996.1 hypothetical protein HK17_14985 [Acetobacter indonesiensis]
MTSIATVTAPVLSKELRDMLDKKDFWTNRKPGALVAEARKVLPQLHAFLAPPAQEKLASEIWKFAEVLNAGVANPLSGEALKVRCVAVEIACDGLPAICWNREAYRAALKRFKFFPSASEIVELLEDQCASAKKYRDLIGYFLRSEDRLEENEKREEENRIHFEKQWAEEIAQAKEKDSASEAEKPSSQSMGLPRDNLDERIANAERELAGAAGTWKGIMQQYVDALKAQRQPEPAA